MKADSKKRQIIRTRTFLFLTPIFHRNFRGNTLWNTSIFHFGFWYLFSSETSKMLPTETLLFSKMKAGSKKRQMTHTGTFLFLTPIAHRNFRDNTHSNISIFQKWKRVLRRDRNRENNILNSTLWRGFAKNYSNLNHKMIMYTDTHTDHVSQCIK